MNLHKILNHSYLNNFSSRHQAELRRNPDNRVVRADRRSLHIEPGHQAEAEVSHPGGV